MRSRAALAWWAVVMAAACGENGLTNVGPSLTISGALVTDTASAVLSSPLAVQVHALGGAPPVGTAVLFQAIGSMAAAAVDTPPFGRVVSVGTDAQGFARVRVQLGREAGTGKVAVSVASLNLSDTAYYTIQPGHPARIQVVPHDSAVFVGGSYGLRYTVTDRNGNPRTDSLAFSLGGGPVMVSAAGVVTGSAVGRGYVLARDAGALDTAWVSVVPPGTLAAWANRLTEPSSVVAFNLDGSAYHLVVKSVYAIYDMVPYWFPDGSRLVYADVRSDPLYDSLRLYTAGLDGSVRRLSRTYSGYQINRETWAQPSHDGQYVYFYAEGVSAQNGGLWRTRVDSQTAVFIGPPIKNGFDFDDTPSPSPDGTRVVYETNRNVTCQLCIQLRILHVSTGAVDSLDVPGETPRWSPVAEQIAFVRPDGSLGVMAPDGSGVHTIGPSGRYYTVGIDWSPDGAWVIVRSDFYDRLELVNAASGVTLPLAFTWGLKEPSWRP